MQRNTKEISKNKWTSRMTETAKEKWSVLVSAFKDDPWRCLAVTAAIAVIILTMLMPLTEWRGRSLLFLITPVISVFFSGILLVQKRLINGVGSALLLAYALWLGVSRIILGDHSLEIGMNRASLALFSAVLAYNLPFLFKKDNGRRIRAIIADLGVVFCTITAIMSIAFVVFGAKPELWGAYNLSESFHLHDGRLYCFNEHPNIGAELFMVGFCLAIMRAMDTKNKIVMSVHIFASVLFFAMLTITDSRACILMACAAAAAAIGIVFFKALRGKYDQSTKNRAIKITVGVLCSVIVFFAAYMSTDGFRAVIKNINSAVISSQTVETPVIQPDTDTSVSETDDGIPDLDSNSDDSVSESDADAAVTDTDVPDTSVSEGKTEEVVLSDRDFKSLKELASLNGRTNIYKHAFKLLIENPKILLFGEQYTQEMIYTTDVFGHEAYIAHWHSSLLEVLFETGVVGLALIVAFVAYIIRVMLKIFFGSFDMYSAADKFALSIPAVSIIIGLIEPMLFSFDIQSALLPSIIYLIFIVMCGSAASEVNEK